MAVDQDITGDSGGATELTILMPCLNEANTIERCVDQAISYLARSGVRGEVLIADNGSTDGSQAHATAKGARVVAIGERGYGAALRGGIAAARGRYVIMGDADDSYDFLHLDEFMAKLRNGSEIVIGNRFRGGIAPGAMPLLHRYLGNPILSLIGRLFFNTRVGDLLCGLRGFNRDRVLALNLHTTGMEFSSEMIVIAALRKLRIAEVPTTLKQDGRSRRPHLRTWRDGWRYLRFMLMFSPRWLFIYPGVFLIAFGIIGAGLLLPGPVEVADGVVLDIHTFIVAAIAILLGFQVTTFGLIARRFAIVYGLLPKPAHFGKFLANVSLERGLILAGAITAAGIAGLVWSLAMWAAVDFGPLDYPILLRGLVLSLTGIAIGIQLAFTAFLSSIIEIPIARDRTLRQ